MNTHCRSLCAAAVAAFILAGGALAQAPDTPPAAPAPGAVAPSSPRTAVTLSAPLRSTAPRTSPPAVTAASPGITRAITPRLASPVRGYALAMKDAAAPARRRLPPAVEPGDQDDPAYAMYKAAYDLILRERWDEAREKFRALSKKYPDSEYRDDAGYWIAYSWRETDSRKAMDEYKRFLKEHRDSKYFDDALADMDQLMARSMAIGVPVPTPDAVTPPRAFTLFRGDSGHAVTPLTPLPSIAPMLKIRRLESMLRTTRPGMVFGLSSGDEDVDDATRLRLESLYALGMTGEDEKGFTILRNIAVDRKEKKVLRVAAIEGLSEYRNHDILPVFIEIAKNDTSEEMQLFAIDYIGSAAHDKGKAFDALITLYRSLPAEKPEKRKMVFYSIAEIGNDQAIDFLAGIARSNDDYELRREAVYYLGTIGGEKARAILYDIVNGK